MEVLPDYRRWPVQVPYPSLLGFLARVFEGLLGISIALGFYLTPEMSPNSACESQYSLSLHPLETGGMGTGGILERLVSFYPLA